MKNINALKGKITIFRAKLLKRFNNEFYESHSPLEVNDHIDEVLYELEEYIEKQHTKEIQSLLREIVGEEKKVGKQKYLHFCEVYIRRYKQGHNKKRKEIIDLIKSKGIKI